MQAILSILMWIIARVQEPSTHAGISALLTLLSFSLPQYAFAIQAVAGLFGFNAVAMKEKPVASAFNAPPAQPPASPGAVSVPGDRMGPQP